MFFKYATVLFNAIENDTLQKKKNEIKSYTVYVIKAERLLNDTIHKNVLTFFNVVCGISDNDLTVQILELHFEKCCNNNELNYLQQLYIMMHKKKTIFFSFAITWQDIAIR